MYIHYEAAFNYLIAYIFFHLDSKVYLVLKSCLNIPSITQFDLQLTLLSTDFQNCQDRL